MTDTPLFPDLPETWSPKIIWLKNHRLFIQHRSEFDGIAEVDLPECPETGVQIYPWRCLKIEPDDCCDPVGVGMTEADAIIDYCRKTDLKHWNVEP